MLRVSTWEITRKTLKVNYVKGNDEALRQEYHPVSKAFFIQRNVDRFPVSVFIRETGS